LGVPTELESYQHQCLMLVDELHEAWADIRRLKGDARTLVAMNDALRAELDAASRYAYAALGCSIGKSGSLPCIWHGTDVAGYIGAGMWIGMMLFGISLPITLAVFFE
nr:hypothetical protein [Tanacetum cinerariifolium]